MTVAIDEDPKRRLAERRDRVLKRLRAGGATAAASPPIAPSTAEGPLAIEPPVDFVHIADNAIQQLDAVQSASRGSSPVATADPALLDQLAAAAARAEADADLMSERMAAMAELKDPRKVQASLEGAQREAATAAAAADRLLAQAAAAHEKGSAELEALFKIQSQEVREMAAAAGAALQTASGAMSAASAAAAASLLRQLASRQETRRAEIAARMQEYRSTEAELRSNRAGRLEEHHRGLAAAARRDHAAHDALTAQLSQSVADQALQLGAAKRDAILAAQALSYNCRVLEERTRENKGVLAELKHSANALEAALAGLRAEHAQRGGTAAEEAARARAEARRADEALQALLQKNRHFEKADAAELKQLAALKKEEFASLGCRLAQALETIKELGGPDLAAPAPGGEVAAPAPPLHEAYWSTKAARLAPADLVARLQELEAAVRADLQLL